MILFLVAVSQLFWEQVDGPSPDHVPSVGPSRASDEGVVYRYLAVIGPFDTEHHVRQDVEQGRYLGG